MSDNEKYITTIEDGELKVKAKELSGNIKSVASVKYITTIVETDHGDELAVKVTGLGGGGGGGTSDYSDLSNKPKINNVTLSGDKTDADLGLQSATSIVTLTTDSTELATNTIYNGAELASVTFTLPATVPVNFTAQLNFTSGTTPTTFTAPATVTFEGDACSNGVFTPVASKRYSVLIYTDGVNVIGLVMGN